MCLFVYLIQGINVNVNNIYMRVIFYATEPARVRDSRPVDFAVAEIILSPGFQ